MHSIVLLTAMTATSGLFGRHKAEGPVSMTRPAYSSCRTGSCPTTAAPTPAYAPAPVYAPAARPMAPAATYSSYYYPAAPSCATGSCPRR